MLKSLKCWNCKKNTGNQTCLKYNNIIPYSIAQKGCEEFSPITTWAEYEEMTKKGIKVCFIPKEWKNEKPQNPRKAFVL